ncbi:hypothetical protein MTY66_62230 (plasmid) [Mycolicibacterium sp. TY66]|uniref:hypothetical protein n=1 Tax=unclassified Mycolicibacterium TaxID=2636767 RepID=UPI001BB3F393|nr:MULTISPECIES: hypothetical protein [unclassified Mycolicibacterium]BCI84598.1 hypothetical protein MTY66_62230 [Mycolicibacterium sp. TY66]BCJ84828.1 hypothetical protein MTY81_62010 [Mycolicibacterium sp. TY81]
MRAGTSSALVAGLRADAVVRELVVTWQHPVERSISPVGLLSFDGQTYTFRYIRNALTVPGFRPFLGFPDLEWCYTSTRLFPLFAQRAMAPRRPDFTRWVHRLGLPEDASPWEQIARSGGRRQGDTIQLFPVPRISDGHLECDFLVHGMRHILERPIEVGGVLVTVTRDELETTLAGLRPGDQLGLCDEPSNRSNPQAILTTTAGHLPLGWMPNLLVDEVHRAAEHGPARVTVRAVNGPEAGWHLRLLATLSADVPDGFEVFTDPSWEPLSTPDFH